MNNYEHTFIAKQDLSETQAKKLTEKYQYIIKNNSGKILKIEEWGLRVLSHSIKNNKKGFYFHIKLEGNGETIEKLENNVFGRESHMFERNTLKPMVSQS